jgi:hypothetical protein
MNMSAWNCYKLFLAMKMHFTTDYDIIKYKGKIRATSQSFTRKGNLVFIFQKLAKKYQGVELINFFLANFINDVSWNIGDLTSIDSHDTFLAWKKRTESLSYVFQQDLERLLNIHNLDTMDRQIFLNDKTEMNHPSILREFLGKKICLETLVILNKLYNFVEIFDSYMSADPIWSDVSRLIKKYSPFLKIDRKYYDALATRQR